MLNLREELLTEYSKNQSIKLADWIGNDANKFAELMRLMLQDTDEKVMQRAAWVFSFCTRKYPDLVKPYLKEMIENLEKPVHDAVKRNSLRALAEIDIPDELLGLTVDICFHFLVSADAAIAIKAFSMKVLENICKKEPELLAELKLVVEERLPFESKAFQSVGRKILAKKQT